MLHAQVAAAVIAVATDAVAAVIAEAAVATGAAAAVIAEAAVAAEDAKYTFLYFNDT
jgi:hypothetical protein